ncbi:hypothetical protein BGM26_11240 [Bacillus sp. FJAT-29790]|uniref:hypothetical protein n=1 Tax=Bacillus sp. FJAT-29790 TaxID=1895002 RepID=UPI001C225568|nr:hypothetical protein [Bacillus sp. FJAT-29790]MBU8879560.1 hypothetical protein [Bacillus sp. FJAT-29790]
MDRPENGRTITIKINGKHRSYQEIKELDKSQGKQEAERESIQETNVPNREIDSFPSIETAAAQEALEDESFDWILPEETMESDAKEDTIAKQPKRTNKNPFGTISKNLKKNNQNSFLSSVLIAVFFAVLLGTSFGLIMLKLVITEKEIATEQPVITVENPGDKQSTGSEKLMLQPLTAFVVQGGVFSTSEAAKQFQDETIPKGSSAQIIEMNGQAFLYLSVADSIEHAKEVGTQFKSKGIDVFAKPITFEEKSLNGLLPEEKKLLEAAPTIYETLAAGAAEATIGNSISDTIAASVEKQSAMLSGIESKLLKNDGIITLKGELDNAIQQLKAYKQSPSQATLTKYQNHLLGFLAAYHSL